METLKFIVIFLALNVPGFVFAQSIDDNSKSLQHVIQIANWLDENAKDSTWPDALDNEETISLSFSDGVSGKIIFYLELYHATGDSSYLQTAVLAGDYLLSNLPQKTDSLKGKFWAFSPYGNVCGSGFALTELYKYSKQPKFKKGALSVFELVKHFADDSADSISWDLGNDVLGGLSGTGLYLLYTFNELGVEEARSMAAKAGRALITRAIKTDNIWNWKRGQNSKYILPNFSHGAAGIGYFMARLYEETNDKEFLDAALKANNYLESIAKTEGGVFLLPYGFPDPGWSRPYDIGWAHGPAGVARFYRQLNKVQPDAKWENRIDQCINGIKASNIPNKPTKDFGEEQFGTDMRFGVAGVADMLIEEERLYPHSQHLELLNSLINYIVNKSTVIDDQRFWEQERFGFMQDRGAITAFTGYFYGAAGYGLLLLNHHYLLKSEKPGIRFVDSPY